MLAEEEFRPAPVPGDCAYCGERRPDVRRLVTLPDLTLPDARGVDICERCLTLAQRRFGGSAGSPHS